MNDMDGTSPLTGLNEHLRCEDMSDIYMSDMRNGFEFAVKKCMSIYRRHTSH